ncbi:HD domain-containing protein [Pseudoduganella buxea]|nr:HD domain-containing protein [Pseudoduganella buxea]MTV55192.1 HD domain-containing protein [Pseudoduganella buxea]
MDGALQSWQPRLVALAAAAAGDDGAHDVNHLHRVWRNAAQLLAEHAEANALIVLAACYLHDLVNLPKNHPERHLASRQAAQLARRELAALDFPADLLPGVMHAIETHSFSAGLAPETIEARIVQDADRLDALGPIGLARMFYTAGRMGSKLAHDSDPAGLSRTLDDRAYSLDHIAVKLATLPGMMRTAAGRRVAQARLVQLEAFRASFIADWSGT